MEVILNASKQADETQIKSMAVVRLLKAFGYTDNALPVAEILARYHNLSGMWTVLSPVHWEATHNDALMTSGGEASRDLFELFQAFVAEEGMQLYYHDASTWLLQCEAHPLPETKPLQQVLNHSMRPLLKALETEPFWLRFLTEAQMFLSQQAAFVNGVWFWGSSACRAPESRSLIVCEDEAWVSAASLISTDVQLYQTDMILPKKGICFVPMDTPELIKKLTATLEKQVIQWSFNDTVYTTKPKNLWARLWGKKT